MNLNLFTNFKFKSYFNLVVVFFDVALFGVFVTYFIHDLFLLISNLLDIFNKFLNYDIISCMAPPTEVNTTGTKIINSNEGWSSSINSIFIYGTGALRYHLVRGGTPGQKGFVMFTTMICGAVGQALENAINNPTYIESHLVRWKKKFNTEKGEVTLTLGVPTIKELENTPISPSTTSQPVDSSSLDLTPGIDKNSFLPDNLEEFSNQIIKLVLDQLKSILEPVSVDYSNELLANQIYGISILLFVLSIGIIILLIAFMINIVILVYSDKLLNYFTNKYILWYIALNKKLIGIEICFLGGSILYFQYNLSVGIRFIATHPIILS